MNDFLPSFRVIWNPLISRNCNKDKSTGFIFQYIFPKKGRTDSEIPTKKGVVYVSILYKIETPVHGIVS